MGYAKTLGINAAIIIALFVVLGVGPIIVPSCIDQLAGLGSQSDASALKALVNLSWCATDANGIQMNSNGFAIRVGEGVYGLGKIYKGLIDIPAATFPAIGVQLYCLYSAIAEAFR